MSKIILIAILILYYPLLRFKYHKIYVESGLSEFLKFGMLRHILRNAAKIRGVFSKKKPSAFMSIFLEHFHTQKGVFKDQALRKKVYDQLYNRLRQGTNYKSLYRIAASDLNPDRAISSKMNKEELAFVQKYFQTHFKHPDNI